MIKVLLSMTLDHYLKHWNLQKPLEIARTPSSDVYQVIFEEQPAVLKLLTPIGEKDEADGAKALAYFDGQGAVRILKSDAKAQLLSFAEGDFLKTLSVSNKDHDATLVACEVIQKLHAKRSAPIPELRTLNEIFSEFLKFTQSDDQELLNEGAVIARHLLETESNKVVLHGDLHHKNIIGSADLGWLAIDPKGYFGERTFDLANLFYNPDDSPLLVETPERIMNMASIFSTELAIPTERILKFAFAFGCLSAYWSIADGKNPARRLRIARLIRNFIDSL